jgi:hypothetical protein
MITNNNCFAYDHGECMALEVDTCEGCNFYKSYFDDFQSRRKVWKRLKELPKEQQKHIQDKYSQSKPLE